MALTNEAKQETEKLLRAGDREGAIQYLNRTFHISSEDAEVLVGALELQLKPVNEEPPPEPLPISGNGEAKMKLVINQFLAQNRKVEAVEYVRHTMNLDLREALITVARAEKDLHTPQPAVNLTGVAGCLRVVAKGLGAFLLFISLLFLGGAAILYYFQYKAIRESDRVTGKVTEMKFLDSDSNESAPVIAYEWKGKVRSYQSHTYSSPPEYKVGEAVALFVNRKDTDDVIIDTFVGRYALIVGLGVIGAVLCLISIVFLYFARRRF